MVRIPFEGWQNTEVGPATPLLAKICPRHVLEIKPGRICPAIVLLQLRSHSQQRSCLEIHGDATVIEVTA
jgi:hypothetical protein